MDDLQEQEKTQMQVVIPDKMRVGVHANIVFVTTTTNGEVILDFIFAHPQENQDGKQVGTVASRVVLPISVAKALNLILGAHVGRAKKAE